MNRQNSVILSLTHHKQASKQPVKQPSIHRYYYIITIHAGIHQLIHDWPKSMADLSGVSLLFLPVFLGYDLRTVQFSFLKYSLLSLVYCSLFELV